jgi:hypothetical protein
VGYWLRGQFGGTLKCPWHIGPFERYDGGPDGQILFGLDTARSAYDHPIPLTTSNASTPNNRNVVVDNDQKAIGVLLGYSPETMQTLLDQERARFAANNPTLDRAWFVNFSSPDLSFLLEYRDPRTNNWQPYNHIVRLRAFMSWPYYRAFGAPFGDPSNNSPTAIRVDPRTDRFSVSYSFLPPQLDGWIKRPNPLEETMYNGFNDVSHASYSLPRSGPWGGIFSYNPAYRESYPNEIVLADIFRNVTGGRAYYTDPDGIVRPADGSKARFATGAGCPTFVGGTSGAASARRPIILNRPFRSVGEIGHAFRDLPFSSVNFSPTDERQSADLGLLDVFCLEEEPEVTAGQINPNRATAEIFEALLDAAPKDENTSTRLSAAEAEGIAGGLVEWITDNGPLRGRDDLAVALANAVEDEIGGDDDANKRIREAAIRALSSLVNTRTWNLMVDLVAQAGRVPTGAAATAANFLVEAETHVWLHVAIDRYTGEVIARQVEIVSE